MMRREPRTRSKAVSVAGFALLLCFVLAGPVWAATTIQLSWSPNTEPDLAGYRLRYGTSSGTYTQTLDVGRVTSSTISGLDSNLTYYFVLHAFDTSGNVSLPSNEASGKPKVVVGAAPTVSSVVEVASNSSYIMQSGRHTLRIVGTNFQSGAVAGLGADATAGATSLSGSTQLTLTVDIAATAALGPRTLTVTNPDSGSGSKASALTLVRTADINRDCMVDGADLNSIGRAWATTSSNPAYNSAADLDADGSVDGSDVAIFAEFFGLKLAVCP